MGEPLTELPTTLVAENSQVISGNCCRLALNFSMVVSFNMMSSFQLLAPNARGEPRPMAAATQERKLLGVGSTAMFGRPGTRC
jgi:hypothetical protein